MLTTERPVIFPAMVLPTELPILSPKLSPTDPPTLPPILSPILSPILEIKPDTSPFEGFASFALDDPLSIPVILDIMLCPDDLDDAEDFDDPFTTPAILDIMPSEDLDDFAADLALLDDLPRPWALRVAISIMWPPMDGRKTFSGENGITGASSAARMI
jgi:hypothetical protein